MQRATASTDCRITLLTPHTPGAVAALQFTGDIAPLLAKLTGATDWPIGKLKLTSIADVDDGLVVRLRDDIAILMPHGGLRIVHQIAEAAVAHGASLAAPADIHPHTAYCEAEDEIEALMLATLARAESPLAIDLLLEQPRRWRTKPTITDDDRARSRRLNRLITPPIVVLVGSPNVGKSTLTNALIGRAASMTADMPGTTRDYTAGRINIAGLVVDWHDTPGIRASDDLIEQRSIEIAHQLLARADLIIAMSAHAPALPHENVWPELPRAADLFVINKCDLQATVPETQGLTSTARKTRIDRASDAPHRISALIGLNLAQFAAAVREALVPYDDLTHPGPWLFDDRLLAAAARHA
jgi:small GTP-binding protein